MKTIRALAALGTLALMIAGNAAHAQIIISNDTTINTVYSSDIFIGLLGESPTVNLVAGGQVSGGVYLYNSSTFNYRGGTITLNRITASSNGVINFFGSGLTAETQGNDPTFGDYYGVSGTLTDGTQLNNAQVYLSDNATFKLNNAAAATPEPGSVALLVGMGVAGVGVLRRRNRRK